MQVCILQAPLEKLFLLKLDSPLLVYDLLTYYSCWGLCCPHMKHSRPKFLNSALPVPSMLPKSSSPNVIPLLFFLFFLLSCSLTGWSTSSSALLQTHWEPSNCSSLSDGLWIPYTVFLHISSPKLYRAKDARQRFPVHALFPVKNTILVLVLQYWSKCS